MPLAVYVGSHAWFWECSSAMLGEKNVKSSHYKNRAILKYFVALMLLCKNLY